MKPSPQSLVHIDVERDMMVLLQPVKLMKNILLVIAAVFFCAAPACAQDATGAWQGTLDLFGSKMRLTLHVEQDDKGALSGTLDSPDMGARGIEVSSVKLKKTSLKFELPTYNGSFEGKIAD